MGESRLTVLRNARLIGEACERLGVPAHRFRDLARVGNAADFLALRRVPTSGAGTREEQDSERQSADGQAPSQDREPTDEEMLEFIAATRPAFDKWRRARAQAARFRGVSDAGAARRVIEDDGGDDDSTAA